MHRSNFAGVVVIVLAGMLGGAAAAAPHYTLGDQGVFGLGENWNFNLPIALINDSVDQFTARFTAREAVTLDRVTQRFIGSGGSLAGTGTTVKLSIVKDNGSGDPSTNLADELTSVIATANENVNAIVFPGAVTLTPGQVYHVVTKGETVNRPFNVFSSTANHSIRPNDRALESQMEVKRRLNQDTFWFPAWTPLGADPYIIFGNGATTVAAPGQPYQNTSATGLFTQGGGGVKYGQQFKIFDSEIEAGSSITVKQITFSALASDGDANGMEPLIIRLRKADGTILASTFMTQAMMNNTDRLLNLDAAAELVQGESYLLTTEIAGSGGTTSDFYFLKVMMAATGHGPATWGGAVDARPVFSPNNLWTTYTPNATDWDLVFSFVATVPEPTGLAVLALLGIAACRRRRSAGK